MRHYSVQELVAEATPIINDPCAVPTTWPGDHQEGTARLRALADHVEKIDPALYNQSAWDARGFYNARRGLLRWLFPDVRVAFKGCAAGHAGDGHRSFPDLAHLYGVSLSDACVLFGGTSSFNLGSGIGNLDARVTPKVWARQARYVADRTERRAS